MQPFSIYENKWDGINTSKKNKVYIFKVACDGEVDKFCGNVGIY